MLGWNQVRQGDWLRLIMGGDLANVVLMELSVIAYALLSYYYLIGIENTLLKCLQG